MIKVLFPPGCYGTYFSRCIYHYSNLREEEFVPFEFDSTGSSHVHRNNKSANLKITNGHFQDLSVTTEDKVLSLVPDNDCNLDYFNNQFHKQNQNHVVEYILSMYSSDEIESKLKANWNYTGALDLSSPTWILREWCSYWLTDVWKDGYNRLSYTNQTWCNIDVTDIVNNIEQALTYSFDYLNLTFTVDMRTIKNTHDQFLASQKFISSQQKCIRWVDAVLNNLDLDLNIQTIFDESYLQHLLRCHGYEIYCNNLNTFPKSSKDMKKVIYKQ